MARTTTPKDAPQDAPQTDANAEAIAALLAELAEAENYAEALTPKTRTRGPKKQRTAFDTAAIIKAASDLGDTADYLDLLDALGIDEERDTYGIGEKPTGPAIRTRLSQLCNARIDGHPISIAENFRPIAPGQKPLYLARKAAATIASQLAALGYQAPSTGDDTATTEATA